MESGESDSQDDNDEEIITEEEIPHLLELAAEHDRVDIIQDVLQRAKEIYDEKNHNDDDVDDDDDDDSHYNNDDFECHHQRVLNFPPTRTTSSYYRNEKKPFI